MSVYRKDDAGNIKKIGGFLEKRFNPTWFECTRTIENGVEVYTVPEAAKDYYTLGFSKVYYFGIFEPNTTDNPKLNFFGQMLAIRDLTQPDNNPAPGTLAGVYQMFTEAATSGETAPTEMALMTTVFAGNMIANVSAKALAAGAQPTVENKGTEYRAELEFGIPKGDTGAPGKDGKDGTSLDIQQQIYESPADLPPFAETTVNQAFVVKNTSDGYDMYFHAVDGTDWTIIPNWGGIQGPQGPQGQDGAEGPEGKPALQCSSVYTNGTPAVDATLTISSTFFNRVAEIGDNTLVVWQANSKSWIVLAEVTAVASNVTLKVVNFVETTGLTGPQGPQGATGATGATGPKGADGQSISVFRFGGTENPVTSVITNRFTNDGLVNTSTGYSSVKCNSADSEQSHGRAAQFTFSKSLVLTTQRTLNVVVAATVCGRAAEVIIFNEKNRRTVIFESPYDKALEFAQKTITLPAGTYNKIQVSASSVSDIDPVNRRNEIGITMMVWYLP